MSVTSSSLSQILVQLPSSTFPISYFRILSIGRIMKLVHHIAFMFLIFSLRLSSVLALILSAIICEKLSNSF